MSKHALALGAVNDKYFQVLHRLLLVGSPLAADEHPSCGHKQIVSRYHRSPSCARLGGALVWCFAPERFSAFGAPASVRHVGDPVLGELGCRGSVGGLHGFHGLYFHFMGSDLIRPVMHGFVSSPSAHTPLAFRISDAGFSNGYARAYKTLRDRAHPD